MIDERQRLKASLPAADRWESRKSTRRDGHRERLSVGHGTDGRSVLRVASLTRPRVTLGRGTSQVTGSVAVARPIGTCTQVQATKGARIVGSNPTRSIMGRVDRFLERRFVLGERDDDRFRDIPRIRHASNLGKCQRQNYYKITKETETEASPYFELGNVFEDLYGAVLAAEYGDFSDDEITNLSNRELIDGCDRLVQDVTCNINLGERGGEEIVITGEADWTILYPGADPVSHVELYEDGSRRVEYADGSEKEFDSDDTPPIELVIETKTSNLDWREKYGHKFEHEYQVRTYMWAFDAEGEIAYIQRDDFGELTFDFRRDSDAEDDMEFRAKQLHMKLTTETLPDADPPRENVCKYCEWNTECKMQGGSRWDDA